MQEIVECIAGAIFEVAFKVPGYFLLRCFRQAETSSSMAGLSLSSASCSGVLSDSLCIGCCREKRWNGEMIHRSRLIVLLFVAGCADSTALAPGRAGTPQSAWMSSRYSSAEINWVYLNFYSEFEDFDRYQGYGIVHYSRSSRRDSKIPDQDLLADALRLCRDEFAMAFTLGQMTKWDHRVQKLVPYRPKFIAVVVNDSKQPNQSPAAEEFGVIVPAAELFSNIPISELLAKAPVSRGNIWYDDITEAEKLRGYSPAKVVRYTHIEEHMQNQEKTVSIEKE